MELGANTPDVEFLAGFLPFFDQTRHTPPLTCPAPLQPARLKKGSKHSVRVVTSDGPLPPFRSLTICKWCALASGGVQVARPLLSDVAIASGGVQMARSLLPDAPYSDGALFTF